MSENKNKTYTEFALKQVLGITNFFWWAWLKGDNNIQIPREIKRFDFFQSNLHSAHVVLRPFEGIPI